jgi:hypothetical protein
MQLEPNTYLGNLRSSVATESKTGTPQIACEFEITHHALNGEWVAIIPQDRTLWLALSDAAWPYTKPKLEVLGFNGNFENPTCTKGEQVQLACKHEEYGGKMREKWDLAEWGGVELAPMNKDKARLWSAKWKAETTQVAPPKGKPAPPARLETVPATPPAKVADSEIPFAP